MRLSAPYLHPSHPYYCIDRCSITKTCSSWQQVSPTSSFFSLCPFFLFCISLLSQTFLAPSGSHEDGQPIRQLSLFVHSFDFFSSPAQPTHSPDHQTSTRADGLSLPNSIGSPIKASNRPSIFDTGRKILQSECHARRRHRRRRHRLRRSSS